MQLKEYMSHTFPGVTLVPYIYSQWENHLHFDFGKDIYQNIEGSDDLNMEYFSQLYTYNKYLFEDIFSKGDTVFIVTNVYRYKKENIKNPQKINVYNRFIKNMDLKFHIRQETLPFLFEDEEADLYCTYQFSLKCLAEDIKPVPLIKAANHEDFPGLYPRFGRKKEISYPDVFLINKTKDIVMFIYDDRGCEVIAKNKEMIRDLYKKYKEWIPDYERESIDDLFRRK
ncbi:MULTISPECIES: DUF3885 domain-containing protein [Bacillus cereus group]|uniref:DUF3885 domain-containing protein n=1 Tax=Bacillus paramycoides TaxID=2026194 RepID=A0ABU6MXM4_9BACI|nr:MULTISPECIES: DUF3885 domain-containing protein [Bacillus cereus group]MED0973295.1 DUF3885 domain-containing protein [Bacillus paramycoides]MED0982240.1 DUF3885 domain-containing protein [Bacillus paramycoides]MED0987384.1 DUF3885 domain-containing protein [Bacillus paramycoides]MED1090911.1 DUF3885 domain-containing protein [Bacillus paramycoides]MED1107424.1 DUF3885 domain-containing protein [Bacillus paramycoides]